ncbi:hypothetical protein PTRA_b0318 [Pseudoalteromonas translucida KMM 520]|uniref:EamA domain-containing protein n=1 Tax=Pseudoalteromonas translucida KMM 520 TaxID=1315283 RepID=A0A0U2MSY4_9GAMM|nr:hypothetical protein PTRA_b0318 [Pseudoalteromonas translucida KMM 520]
MQLPKQHRHAELLLVTATIIAASGWIFSKEAIQHLPAFGFIGIRFLLAALCLLPFCYRDLCLIRPIVLLKAFSVGSVLGCALLLWIYAVSISETLGEGAFIMTLSQLFVPLFAWLLFTDKPTTAFWYSLPFAIIGLVLLSALGEWNQSSTQLWFLLAAIMLAIHFNLNSRYAQRVPVLLLTCIQLCSIGIIGLVISAYFEVWPDVIPSSTWRWVGLSIIVATSLRYAIQTKGQKGASAANAAVIMILEPIWVFIISIIWFAETMSLYKIIGCSLILLSILINRGMGQFVPLYLQKYKSRFMTKIR